MTKAELLIRYAVFLALRNGTWWEERQKINGGN